MDKDDYRSTPLWGHEGKRLAFQMYSQGYDDPVTAYQILSGEEMPSDELEAEQMDFEEYNEEEF
ncbi:MAG: hypothetical protein ACOYVD_02860 [Bacillota bacterium]